MLNISSQLKYVNRKNNKYVKIDICILQNPDIFTNLSGTAFKIYILLKSYFNPKLGYVFPHVSTLAKRAGVSAETVRRAIKELEKYGLITIQRNCKGNSNRYYFNEEIESPNINDSRNNNFDTVPTQITEETPHNCGIYVTKNFNKFKNLTTTNKQIQNSETNDVVDDVIFENDFKQIDKKPQPENTNTLEHKDTYIKELIDKYKDYKTKISSFPLHKELFLESYLSTLKNKYDPDLVELAAQYTRWSDACSVKVIRPNKFIKWILKNPYEADFTEYFTYLEKLYQREQALLKQKKYQEQQRLKNEQDEEDRPSVEETTEFFKKLKAVIKGSHNKH